jgi:hypothetical protein
MPPARNNVHNPNKSAIREPDPLAMKITSKEIELGNSNPKTGHQPSLSGDRCS